MNPRLADAARGVMALAEKEARGLQHDYLGTEHILLGLVQEESGAVADVLRMFGLDAAKIQREIERMVQRGSQPVAAGKLPLTPRSMRVLEYAAAEARSMSEEFVGPEHLMIGLFRMPDGVAGLVLRNLGLELEQLVAETFRIRVMQMKTVERAVRPVCAGTAWKRKTREELLSHLTAIYEEERSKLHDPEAAMQAAAKRFGDPAEISREFQAALPNSERRAHLVERLFGWRAPESAFRYMRRQALVSLAMLAIVCSIFAAGTVIVAGWKGSGWPYLRRMIAFLLITPAAQFLLGWMYYKLRDALYGPIWAKKSAGRVVAWTALIIAATFISGVGFVAVVTCDAFRIVDSLAALGAISLTVAATELALAKSRGPLEIRDTLWALLNLES
jgi:ATP-dependent Clp protease ATP-binding subunit ClpC